MFFTIITQLSTRQNLVETLAGTDLPTKDAILVRKTHPVKTIFALWLIVINIKSLIQWLISF
jgi:hypothetical protein